MTDGVSPQLKAAMEEIKEVLDRNQIAGTIFLSDGRGSGEFLIGIDRPDWSNLRFVEKNGKTMIHTKMHAHSAKENTDRTVNALYSQMGMMIDIIKMKKQIADSWEKHVEIEKDQGTIVPHKRT